MGLAGLLLYSGALFIAAAIPGPGITALVARALGSGFAATLPMMVGIILGDIFYLTAAILGLAFIAQTFGTVFLIIKYLGALYLVWIAYKLWSQGIAPDTIKAKPPMRIWATFLSGFLLTLGNPKTILFYVALLPTLLDLEQLTPADYTLLVFATATILTVVFVPYIALASRLRGVVKQGRTLRLLNRLAASILGATAISIALRAH